MTGRLPTPPSSSSVPDSMTDSTPTPAPTDAPLPYEPPTMILLGAVEALTAGPVANGGDIDMLVGLSGGFGTGDGTS